MLRGLSPTFFLFCLPRHSFFLAVVHRQNCFWSFSLRLQSDPHYFWIVSRFFCPVFMNKKKVFTPPPPSPSRNTSPSPIASLLFFVSPLEDLRGGIDLMFVFQPSFPLTKVKSDRLATPPSVYVFAFSPFFFVGCWPHKFFNFFLHGSNWEHSPCYVDITSLQFGPLNPVTLLRFQSCWLLMQLAFTPPVVSC